MKSFSSFLYETIEKGSFGYEHNAVIGGHKLSVDFNHLMSHRDESQNKYSLSYTVNNKFNKRDAGNAPVEPKTGAAMVHHVGGVVSRFIQEKNPKALYMRGDTPHKHRLYGKFMKKLRKKHGGYVVHDQQHHIWSREPYEPPK